MTMRSLTLPAMLAAGAIAAGACDSSTTGPSYDPQLPTAWVATVSNTHFPLVVGTTYRYEAQTANGLETITVEVLPGTRVISGVTAVEVHDRVYLDGVLIEDTYDWYAQDDAGNVWYLGEETKEYENGQVVSTEGSWEWGVGGALPGIIMWADPAAHIGEQYRQEFFRGEAEDWGKVVAVSESVTVPYGSFTGCLEIEEWNALEPGPHEHKYYCAQLGTVLEVAGGSGERVELI
ncbi:MAG: hypothetical protein ACREMR_09910, partial [Gemmatimonadales bacterium]